MSEELKLILKQNRATQKLIQCALYCLGMSRKDLQKNIKIIEKEVEEEFKDYE